MNSLFIFLFQTISIYTNSIEETQQAAFPLLLLLLCAGGGGILAFALYILFSGESPTKVYNKYRNVNLAILGPNEAGKTTLWNYLKGVPFSKEYFETDGKTRVSFVSSNKTWYTKKSNNSEEKIKFSGYDINGNGDFIKVEWEELIKESDMIIFIFNANKYLFDIDYQRDVNQRMQYVKYTIDKQNDGRKRNVWLLGSYADLLSNKKEQWRKIIDIIKTKPYSSISHNNACVNLTNKKELDEYYKKMFTE